MLLHLPAYSPELNLDFFCGKTGQIPLANIQIPDGREMLCMGKFSVYWMDLVSEFQVSYSA